MASKAAIVADIMRELGKTSSDLAAKIERLVGEITVDLLNNNDARFEGLSKSQTITLTASTTDFLLPTDYRTAKRKSVIVNSSGQYVGDFELVTEAEYYRRKSDDQLDGTEYGYIRFDEGDMTTTRGYYLTIGSAYSETGYLKFLYYRQPETTDTDIIKNPRIVKVGVRALLDLSLNPDAPKDAAIYERMKEGFIETPDPHVSSLVLRPRKSVQDHNRFMHRIGEGD